MKETKTYEEWVSGLTKKEIEVAYMEKEIINLKENNK